MKLIRVGVTGGRDYTNRTKAYDVLSKAHLIFKERMFLVVGCARGLDSFAREWANLYLAESQWKVYRADWPQYGKKAGHLRNQVMAESGLNLLIAFPGGVGTADMKRQVTLLNQYHDANIKCLEIFE